MNYLALCNKMCTKIGYAKFAAFSSVGPDQALVMEWIADAWTEIQEMRQQWSFMESPATINILTDKEDYSPIEMGLENIGHFVGGRLMLIDSAGKFVRYLQYISGAEMEYRRVADPATGSPEEYTDKHGQLALYPKPADAYTLKVHYIRTPVELEVETDEPAMGEQFHKAIIYYALMEYAVSDNSPEDFQFGNEKFEQYLNRMDKEYSPQPSMSGRKTANYYNAKHFIQ